MLQGVWRFLNLFIHKKILVVEWQKWYLNLNALSKNNKVVCGQVNVFKD